MDDATKISTSDERGGLAISAPRHTSHFTRRPLESSPPVAGESSSTSNDRGDGLSAGTAWSRAVVRSLAAGFLLGFAALLALPLQAQAQTTLVSNTGQTDSGSRAPGTNDFAQSFDTGNNSGGYNLTSIGLDFQAAPTGTDTLTVTVRANSSGDPSGTVLYTLTNPSLSAGLNEFSAPGNAPLNANATYWVVASYNSGTGGPTWYRVSLTNGVDAGAAAGWDIDAAYKVDSRTIPDGWAEQSSTRALQIAVKGTIVSGTNTAPTGAPTITGTAQVGETLTAVTTAIMDDDGLTTPGYTYQWIRVDSGTDSDISMATASTYTLVTDDLGTTIKVKVSFTDDASNAETLTSVATAAVAAAADTTPPTLTSATVIVGGTHIALVFSENLQASNPPTGSAFTVTADGSAVRVTNTGRSTINPAHFVLTVSPLIRQGQAVVVTYTDPTGGNDTNAIQDAAGNDVATFTTGLNSVPGVTNSSTLAATAPGAPTGLTATASGTTQIDLSWTAPADNGGRVITGYKIEISPNGTDTWTTHLADTTDANTTYSHTGLAASTTRHYRVSAINTIGTSTASNIDDATTGAATNTLPTAANGEVTATEDTDYTFTAANFNFSDTDAGAALSSVKITSLPASGNGHACGGRHGDRLGRPAEGGDQGRH